jgi:hypothetical protein
MSKIPGSTGKSFWIWILGNLLGVGAMGAALLLLPSLMNLRGILASTLIISLPLSVAQWLALRRISGTSILWVLTIPVGLMLGLLILQNLPEGLWQGVDDESIAVLTAGYLLIGLMIGIPQWLILRRQFSGSSIWLLGSSAAMGASLWLVLVTDLINRSGPFAFIVGVTVYGLITGLILWRLAAWGNQSQVYGASAD